MRTVPVELAGRRYEVLVGPGALARLPDVVPAAARRAAVITQASVPVEIETGLEQHVVVIPDGEQAKTLSCVEQICRDLASAGFTRSDLVIGVGGGVVTDVAGFAASVYHRGIAVAHVATTLLAQVDAAIGGKTGVNLPEGKNLVGAFWQPVAVICDTDTLATLPERERRSGLGELAKYHFIGGAHLAGLPLVDQIAEAAAIKARVVAADERESDLRATLNYGHTLAHALEVAGAFDLRHGEAVAIGLMFAAMLAERMDRIPPERVKDHRAVIEGYGLPAALPSTASDDRLLALMKRDKKSLDGGLTFVLDGPAGVEVVRNVSDALVLDTLKAMERA